MNDSQNRGILGRGISRRDLLKGFAAAGILSVASRSAFGADEAATAVKPVRIGLLGDWGSGDGGEAAIAEQMAALHGRTALDMIVTAGDNIYPNGSAENFGSHFEKPFESLIKSKVPFYSCLGNHDVKAGADAQMRFPLFNMGGTNYYRVAQGGGTVEFFMLDSNAMDAKQLDWLDRGLQESKAVWKVPVFHHPIYSSGKSHGSDLALRKTLEPILVRNKVKVAFSGHDHMYQRVTLQQGVQYFISGAGGQIREGDLNYDSLVAKGYDADSHFMEIEADATRFSFRAINTKGEAVDQGEIKADGAVASLLRRFNAA